MLLRRAAIHHDIPRLSSCAALHPTGKLRPTERPRCINRFCGTAPSELVDRKSVTMLLSPHAIRNQKDKGGGHGNDWERQLLPLWHVVQQMKVCTEPSKGVGVCEQRRSP